VVVDSIVVVAVDVVTDVSTLVETERVVLVLTEVFVVVSVMVAVERMGGVLVDVEVKEDVEEEELLEGEGAPPPPCGAVVGSKLADISSTNVTALDTGAVLDAKATSSMYAIPPGFRVSGSTLLPERRPLEGPVMLKFAQLVLFSGSAVIAVQ